MCRNIRTLHNFEPPATDDEIRAACLQFVRKIGGSSRPSRANREAYDRAVENMTALTREFLGALSTSAPPRDRETEAAKARARFSRRSARG